MGSAAIRVAFAACMALAAAMPVFGDAGFGMFEFEDLEAPVFYAATSPIGKGSNCELAVVQIHGASGGMAISKEAPAMLMALKAAIGDGGPEPYVIAPLFPGENMPERGGGTGRKRAVWKASRKKAPDGAGRAYGDWRGGGDAVGTTMSSYDVVDAIFAALGDKKKFPALKRVVLTGFSAGGQFVARYVAVGKGFVRKGVVLEYAVMAPSSEFHLDPDSRWHYGLKNRPRYSAGLTESDILKNLSRRRVWRGCGTADVKTRPHTRLDVSPAAMRQGENRYARFLNFEKYLKRYPSWAKQVTFHSFEGMGHWNPKAHSDPAFIKFVIGR